ncbi:hypothetical protein AF332_27775 [Sporosarcina globispora]|uniref:Uncharacterized protein n=1 Tax=Sporosarcina globispora TaxID=1459 RepID=A0A0M0G1T8_SPOGL|nr:hypothetical protein [Sporosarcina globispora]KON83547.1 hypothetical protein AF332_27775 [Sporosarcina globispora]
MEGYRSACRSQQWACNHVKEALQIQTATEDNELIEAKKAFAAQSLSSSGSFYDCRISATTIIGGFNDERNVPGRDVSFSIP